MVVNIQDCKLHLHSPPALYFTPARQLTILARFRTRVVVVVIVEGRKPTVSPLCAPIFSITLAISQWQVRTAAQLPCWLKQGNVLIHCVFSLLSVFILKSRFFVYWMKPLIIPFCVIRFDLLIIQLCSWNKSKHVAVVQCCSPPLSFVKEEMTSLHSNTKTTIESLNTTQNIVWPVP